jgi:hypothetical protein
MTYGLNNLDTRTERGKLISTVAAMKNERSSWDPHWMEIEKFLSPRSGRFTPSDRNKGGKKHQNIYDNTGTRALRVLGAGIMSGATNPSRPWFRLSTPDKQLMKSEAVKIWLNEVTQLILDIFSRSNTYRALHSIYEEIGGFGTACNIITDSFDKIIHNNVLAIGEFSLATDHENMVNALAREFEMTVQQMIARFEYRNCSRTVQQLWNQGNMTAWVPVIHIIEPRTERDPKSKDAQDMPFKSCYIEPGRDDGDEKYLRNSGFKQFRALAPRWAVTSNDIYGSNCPGMEALGDIKQLQHEQVRKAEGIDYKTKPPLHSIACPAARRITTRPVPVPECGRSSTSTSIFPTSCKIFRTCASASAPRSTWKFSTRSRARTRAK